MRGLWRNVDFLKLWTGQTISSSGRTAFRGYEIKPFPLGSPSMIRTGTVSDPSLWVFNGAMAPDRAVPAVGEGSSTAHFGDSFVIGFSTSSSTTRRSGYGGWVPGL